MRVFSSEDYNFSLGSFLIEHIQMAASRNAASYPQLISYPEYINPNKIPVFRVFFLMVYVLNTTDFTLPSMQCLLIDLIFF